MSSKCFYFSYFSVSFYWCFVDVCFTSPFIYISIFHVINLSSFTLTSFTNLFCLSESFSLDLEINFIDLRYFKNHIRFRELSFVSAMINWYLMLKWHYKSRGRSYHSDLIFISFKLKIIELFIFWKKRMILLTNFWFKKLK